MPADRWISVVLGFIVFGFVMRELQPAIDIIQLVSDEASIEQQPEASRKPVTYPIAPAAPRKPRYAVPGLGEKWQVMMEEFVADLWKQVPDQVTFGKTEGWVVQFVDGKIYSSIPENADGINPWERERIYNLFRLLLAAVEIGGKFPNFEFRVTGADCPCSKNHCFAPITCDTDHSEQQYLNFPFVQWLTSRDEFWSIADVLVREKVDYALGLKWKNRKNIAVFRGAMNSATTIRGLPHNPFKFRLNRFNWLQYGRGKLLSLRQEEGAEKYIDVFLSAGHFMHLELWTPWEEAIKDMHMDKPEYLSLKEQADQFKYSIYAEGECGWADRLKWQLAYGMVPIIQETRCGEWYTKMLKPWIHYIPVDGKFTNLTAAVEWAQENDDVVRRMSSACMEFAINIINPKAMAYYTRILFDAYIERIQEADRPSLPRADLNLWQPTE